jgi:hypothetical protein
MIGKILLTLAVVLGAWFVIRARMTRGGPATSETHRPPPLVPPAALRAVAYGLVAVLVAGSLMWLYLDWEAGRGLVTVRVINANTGQETSYQARREDVGGRHFTTLDGRRVNLAEVERMVIEDAAPRGP